MATLSASEDGSGAYIGVGMGSTAYVDDNFAKEQLKNSNVTGTVESRGFGTKLFGGYQFNSIVGIEAAYVYYGNFSPTSDYTYSAQGVSTAVNVGYGFLENQLRPYILIGLGYVFSDFPHEGVPVDDQSPTLHIGFGLDYTPKSLGGIGFRGAYDGNSFSYLLQRDTPEEKRYIQAFGLLYVGCYYKF